MLAASGCPRPQALAVGGLATSRAMISGARGAARGASRLLAQASVAAPEANTGVLDTQRQRLESGLARQRSSPEASTSGREGTAASVELVYGPMFAGKTTHLVKQLSKWKAQGPHHRLLVAKSKQDDRYSSLDDSRPHERLQRGHIVTHGGERHECFAVERLQDLRQHVDYDQAEIICIDEAHFLPDLVDFCTEAAKTKRLLVAGLDLDYRRQPIGEVLALAEALKQAATPPKVEHLLAACAVCGQRAQYTQRLVSSQAQFLVGSKDKYQPVCERHHS